MTEQKDKAYRFRPLTEYTFRERLIIRIGGWAFYALISIIGKTLRFEVEGSDYLDNPARGYEAPIVCAWHDRIFSGAYFLHGRGLVVMSSISFDAEYTARCIQRFGFGIVKGSSTRGGTRALVEMIRLMKQGVAMVFTVDGPRGPRYEVKAGPALLAKKTGNPMLPFGLALKRYWTINSWDKAQIPKPFSRARVYFGEPIMVPPGAGESELEQKRLELEAALNDLVKRGDQWAAR